MNAGWKPGQSAIGLLIVVSNIHDYIAVEEAGFTNAIRQVHEPLGKVVNLLLRVAASVF